jgi:hypothetical protein
MPKPVAPTPTAATHKEPKKPFSLDNMLKALNNFAQYHAFTAKDAKDYLLQNKKDAKEMAKYFFKAKPGVALLFGSMRKDLCKDTASLRELIIKGGPDIREAMIKYKLLDSKHLSKDARSEMLVLMKLMGEKVEITPNDVQVFNKRQGMISAEKRASEHLLDHLANCFENKNVDQAKVLIGMLFADKEFKPLLDDMRLSLNTKGNQFAVELLNNLAALKDPEVNKFIANVLDKMDPKKFTRFSHGEFGKLSDDLKGIAKDRVEAITKAFRSQVAVVPAEKMEEAPKVVPPTKGFNH